MLHFTFIHMNISEIRDTIQHMNKYRSIYMRKCCDLAAIAADMLYLCAIMSSSKIQKKTKMQSNELPVVSMVWVCGWMSVSVVIFSIQPHDMILNHSHLFASFRKM